MKDSSRKFWFRFFWRDWLASPSIAALTLEQEAAYLRLMSFHYDCGSLPNDHAALERMVGKKMSKGAIAGVAALFSPSEKDPTRLVHQRVLEELEEIKVWMEKCSGGGKKSAEIRALKRKGGSSTLETVVEPPLEPRLQLNSNQIATKSQLNAQLKPSQLQSQSQLHEGNVGGSSYVEVKGDVLPQGPQRATEPPPGMPRSEQEAVDIGATAGIAPELCRLKYAEAESVGFVDWKGRPIRNFRSWLVVEKNAKVSREAEKKANPPKTSYHERPWRKGEAVPPKDQPPDKSNPLLWREWCDTHYNVGYAPGETKEEYRARTF